MEQYKVTITSTSKGYHAKDEYDTFDENDESFDTFEAARQFVADKYGSSKRAKMYQDRCDGEVIHIGWIYCFNCSDKTSTPPKHWRQQDWVTIYREKTERLLPCVMGW